MKLSDKNALLLCVEALPTADVWHEISQDEMIEIFKQASRELARLESIELEAAQQSAEADVCFCSSDKKHSWKDYTMGHVVLCEWCGLRR